MANNTGVFFNINDNDGIPLVGVSTDGRVLINHLYGNCLIGSTSSTGTASQPLQVSGGAYFSGNTGIGTTNPTAKLDVNGTLNVSDVSTISVNSTSNALRITQTGIGNALLVEDSTNPDVTPFVITASGSVGIGTTNPSSTLHLRRSSGELASFEVTSASSAYFSFTSEGTQFGYFGSASGFITTGTRVDLGLRSNDNILFSIGNAEKLRLNSSGTFLVGTASSTGTASQQLQVNSGGYFNGSVGIGTTNPTAKLDVLGDVNISGILTASKVASGIPQNSKTSAYILQKSDVGKYISITSGGVTVPSGIFSEGDVISVYNNSASNQTITQGDSVTMYFSGTSTTGNRTLSQRGLSTILCVGSNTFIIGGAGLS